MNSVEIDFNIYLITDRKLFRSPDLFFNAVRQALEGGIKSVQLREKDLGIRQLLDFAYEMRKLTKRYNARLFINDRVDIALAVEADGVHLGSESIGPEAARRAADKKILIGVSTHGIEQAKRAELDGADFITMGPVYETSSKTRYGAPLGLDIIRKTADSVSLPVFGIGGINKDTAVAVLNAGASGIALISGILGSKDIENETKELVRTLK